MDEHTDTTAAPAGRRADWRAEVAFLRRVLIVAAVAVLALFLWRVRDALLLLFGAVVVAVLLLAGAHPLERRLGLSRTWSLTVVAAAVALGLALVGVLIGGQIRSQVAQLGDRLPRAVEAFEGRFGVDVPTLDRLGGGQPPGGRDGARRPQDAAPQGPNLADGASIAGGVVQEIARIGYAVLNTVATLVLVVVGGFFLAATPERYRTGVVKLLPVGQHARAEDALEASGRALKLWLLTQLVSMCIIAVLVGLGTWLIGLPSPLALALFAGMVEFVPIIGPVAAAVPALLLALAQGGGTFLWTLALYVAIQQIETNVLTPLVQDRMADLPPAMMLFAVVAAGSVFGLGGVLLAAPLAVVIYVLVKKLYVRQTLGEETEVPGEGR